MTQNGATNRWMEDCLFAVHERDWQTAESLGTSFQPMKQPAWYLDQSYDRLQRRLHRRTRLFLPDYHRSCSVSAFPICSLPRVLSKISDLCSSTQWMLLCLLLFESNSASQKQTATAPFGRRESLIHVRIRHLITVLKTTQHQKNWTLQYDWL